GYASPERQLLFDINDFDETLPGPFEFDLKRLAASFAIAARSNTFTEPEVRSAARRVAKSYRKAMAAFADLGTMDTWYARMSDADVLTGIERLRDRRTKKATQQLEAAAQQGAESIRKARGRTSLQALSKLAEVVDGRARIVSRPPLLVPLRELESYYG